MSSGFIPGIKQQLDLENRVSKAFCMSSQVVFHDKLDESTCVAGLMLIRMSFHNQMLL